MHDRLDAEGFDVRPGKTWVNQVLHGMRLSCKKPAKCLEEIHSPEQQHANTHRLYIKLCWLMDKHAVSADRVVNIDETSCRLLPVYQVGWDHRGVKQAQLQGNAKEATTLTVAFSMDRGALDMLVQIVQAGQDRRRPARGAHSPRHVRVRLGHHDDAPAAHSHIGQRAEPEQRRTGVGPSLGHGSIHASEATMTAMRAMWPSSAA